jgi:hypothetical protein
MRAAGRGGVFVCGWQAGRQAGQPRFSGQKKKRRINLDALEIDELARRRGVDVGEACVRDSVVCGDGDGRVRGGGVNWLPGRRERKRAEVVRIAMCIDQNESTGASDGVECCFILRKQKARKKKGITLSGKVAWGRRRRREGAWLGLSVYQVRGCVLRSENVSPNAIWRGRRSLDINLYITVTDADKLRSE